MKKKGIKDLNNNYIFRKNNTNYEFRNRLTNSLSGRINAIIGYGHPHRP